MTDIVPPHFGQRKGFTSYTFAAVLDAMRRRVPSVTNVEAKSTEDGRLVLRFQDGAFRDPFVARNVSDGTIKMFAYLILLHDPRPFPLLAVEKPENQLCPELLVELATVAAYTDRHSSVHSGGRR